MMESGYASSVTGNLFWRGALHDLIEAPSSENLIVGGLAAIVDFLKVLPNSDLIARDFDGRSPLGKAAVQRMEAFGLGLMMRAKEIPGFSRRLMDARDFLGNTVLGISICYDCSLPFLEALIDYGAEVNPDALPSIWTPLQTASWFGYSAIVELLLRHGAKKDGGFPGAKSALDLAQDRGHNDVVQLLGGASPISPVFHMAQEILQLHT